MISAEPTLADEHRASAERHRSRASGNRDFVEAALERAGDL
ncbi:hypothetical protein ACPCUV_29720 [Streptomyces platensis]